MKNKTKDYNAINWNDMFVEDASSPTGLVWKISPSRCTKVGDVAGSIKIDKQRGRERFIITYKKTNWFVHRVLWVMRNGTIEADLEIDHIDGNALNNSVDNLRLVDSILNKRNRKQPCNNSSGATGVIFWVNKSANTYARAQWQNSDGEREARNFSCNKLGLLPAFASACSYREKIITELNNTGAGYSERHGSN